MLKISMAAVRKLTLAFTFPILACGLIWSSSVAHAQAKLPPLVKIPRPGPKPTFPPLPPLCQDCDGDGDRSPRFGGNDCDDNDARRYTGATEVCDAEGLDEDCDLTTSGSRDEDGDGIKSAACFNKTPDGQFYAVGRDCDDSNPAIVPGALTCIPNASGARVDFDGLPLSDRSGTDKIYMCSKGGTLFDLVSCGAGLSCVPQPNGTGICAQVLSNIPTIPGERP
jgi:hypothetical protein